MTVRPCSRMMKRLPGSSIIRRPPSTRSTRPFFTSSRRCGPSRPKSRPGRTGRSPKFPWPGELRRPHLAHRIALRRSIAPRAIAVGAARSTGSASREFPRRRAVERTPRIVARRQRLRLRRDLPRWRRKGGRWLRRRRRSADAGVGPRIRLRRDALLRRVPWQRRGTLGPLGGGIGATRSGRPGAAGRCGASVDRGGGVGLMVRGACGVAGVAGVARGAGRSWRCSPPRLRRSSSSFASGRCAWAPLISVPPARPTHAVPTRAAVIADRQNPSTQTASFHGLTHLCARTRHFDCRAVRP